MHPYVFRILLFLTCALTVLVTTLRSHDENGPLPEADLLFNVGKTPLHRNPCFLGLNLNSFQGGGLRNPGFNEHIERAIVSVRKMDTFSFSDEARWESSNDHWNGAKFEVLSGAFAGYKGKVLRSRSSGKEGLPQYFTHSVLPPLEERTVIALTKSFPEIPPDFWEIKGSLQLERKKGGFPTILELQKRGEGDAALLQEVTLVGGGQSETFSFWGKGKTAEALLEVTLVDSERNLLLKENISLNNSWNQYLFEVPALEEGKTFQIIFSIAPQIVGETVAIAQCAWEGVEKEDPLVRKFSPGVIREFPSIGNRWENCLEPAVTRKPWVFRFSNGMSEVVWQESLSTFLDFCEKSEATPWLFLPCAYGEEECLAMGRFLRENAPKERFSEVIVEFGYQQWNWRYRAHSLPYYKEVGEVATRAFYSLEKEVGGRAALRKVISGPYLQPSLALKYLDAVKEMDVLCVSVDLFSDLERALPDREILQNLYGKQQVALYSLVDACFEKGKGVVVGALTLGNAPSQLYGYEQRRIYTSAAAGIAFGKQILEIFSNGIDVVAVQDFGLQSEPFSFVAPSGQLRPAGQVVRLLQGVCRGQVYSSGAGEQVLVFPFLSDGQWRAAIVSNTDESLTIDIKFPLENGAVPEVAEALHFHSPFDNNEGAQLVNVVPAEMGVLKEGRIRISVPPYGLVTLH